MMNDGTTKQSKDSELNSSPSEYSPPVQNVCSANTNHESSDLINALQRLASHLEVSTSGSLQPISISYENSSTEAIPPKSNTRCCFTLVGDSTDLKTTHTTKHNGGAALPLISTHSPSIIPRQEEGDIAVQKQRSAKNDDSSLLSLHPGEESIGESRFESCKDCDRGMSLLDGNPSTSISTNTGLLPVLSFREDQDMIPNYAGTETCTPTLIIPEKGGLSKPTTCQDLETITSIKTIPQVGNTIKLPMKPFKMIENALGTVSLQQKEVLLQPPKLLKLAFTPLVPPSKVVLEHNDEPYETPPPSYHESVFKQPAPSYTSHETSPNIIKSCCPVDPPKNEAHVSIIRLSNPQTRTHFTRFANSPSQSALIWHSSGDELNSGIQDHYSDHQLLALLACITFWPIGLLAIYYANMASILRSEGIHQKAIEYSKRALGLSLISFLVGTGVYITFYFKR